MNASTEFAYLIFDTLHDIIHVKDLNIMHNMFSTFAFASIGDNIRDVIVDSQQLCSPNRSNAVENCIQTFSSSVYSFFMNEVFSFEIQ